MKIKLLLGIILILFLKNTISANDLLLEEYKLLYIDLMNINTYGYKSYYNHELHRAENVINNSQGIPTFTDVNTDIAIIGDGFIKIKLNDNLIGYTRYGSFKIDEYGELIIQDGFSLNDPIYLPEYFLPDTLKINQDHAIYVTVADRGEILIGYLKTYMVPMHMLEHYRNGIYILREQANDIEFNDNRIFNKFLESSNLYILSVLLRMYYILTIVDENIVPNIEFKKDLIKMQLSKMANTNYILENKIIRKLTEPEDFAYDQLIKDWTSFLKSILPFIRYDY
jgi:flagellar basal body rod protein FlgG